MVPFVLKSNNKPNLPIPLIQSTNITLGPQTNQPTPTLIINGVKPHSLVNTFFHLPTPPHCYTTTPPHPFTTCFTTSPPPSLPVITKTKTHSLGLYQRMPPSKPTPCHHPSTLQTQFNTQTPPPSLTQVSHTPPKPTNCKIKPPTVSICQKLLFPPKGELNGGDQINQSNGSSEVGKSRKVAWTSKNVTTNRE